jgi:hypothetical protein
VAIFALGIEDPLDMTIQLCEIDDLAAIVMIRLRTLQRSGARRDAEGLPDALGRYVEAVKSLAGIE